MYSNRFLVESLGFSIYRIMSSAKKWQFHFFLPYLDAFSFSCPIALAGTLSTMLIKSHKSGHSFPVPDVREKVFSFSPLSIVLAKSFSHMVCIMLRYFLYLLYSLYFNHKWMLMSQSNAVFLYLLIRSLWKYPLFY